MALDVNQYMNATHQGENATKMTPIPAGEYKSVISNVVLESLPGKKDVTKTYLKCLVTHQLDDAGLRGRRDLHDRLRLLPVRRQLGVRQPELG